MWRCGRALSAETTQIHFTVCLLLEPDANRTTGCPRSSTPSSYLAWPTGTHHSPDSSPASGSAWVLGTAGLGAVKDTLTEPLTLQLMGDSSQQRITSQILISLPPLRG